MRLQLARALTFSACVLSVYAAGTVRTASTVHSWEKRSAAPDEHSIKLHIGLRLEDDGEAIETRLLAVSQPGSPSFRQHLSAAEACELSKPSSETTREVEKWLNAHGLLEQASLHAGIYEIDTNVASAQRLLNTTYHIYSHGTQTLVRTDLYNLPAPISTHIDFVTPTTFFPEPRIIPPKALPPSTQSPILSSLSGTCKRSSLTSPSCLRKAYNISFVPSPNRTVFAVYATESATFQPLDLSVFLSRYRPSAAKSKYTVIGNGKVPGEKPGGIEPLFETALDTQTLIGIAAPAAGEVYLNGGVFGPEPGKTWDRFLGFLMGLLDPDRDGRVPSVISFSESAPENLFDPAYAKRVCGLMAQIGAMGTTLVFSVGDDGPSSYAKDKGGVYFAPRFPASCPWVTAVGGTTDLENETAATLRTIPVVDRVAYSATGGGFSGVFGRPGYQERVAGGYVREKVPGTYKGVKGFNPGGRGYPDVAAFSTSFPVVVDLITFPVGGTSASTPTWAGVIALLNDYEAGKGRPALGFVNPWLYGLNGKGLKDITTGGDNAGSCGLKCGFKTLLGFNVTEGWDPVTGLGSPVFDQLTKALDDLDAS